MDIVNEYLAFSIGNEEYGINILEVQEIRKYEVPTRIVNAPSHFRGVLNLRGKMVPITDMHQLLLSEESTVTDSTVTVFCTSNDDVRGIVVDAVNDVIRPTKDEIKPTGLLGGETFKLVNAIASLQNNRQVLLTSLSQLLGIHRPLDEPIEPLAA